VRAAWQLLSTRRQWDESVGPAADPSRTTRPRRTGGEETAGTGSRIRHARPVGRYEIQEVLGSGGFGTVYRATDPQLQRAVALKVPHRDRIGSAERRAMYLHEARAAARLKHPGLVAVYDVQEDGDGIYIVQEYVDGQDLGAGRPPRGRTPTIVR
jgi:serine/threonine protein kinase